MTEADPVDRRSEQYDVLDTLASGRDDTTPIAEVLTQLRDARYVVTRERNQRRVSDESEM